MTQINSHVGWVEFTKPNTHSFMLGYAVTSSHLPLIYLCSVTYNWCWVTLRFTQPTFVRLLIIGVGLRGGFTQPTGCCLDIFPSQFRSPNHTRLVS